MCRGDLLLNLLHTAGQRRFDHHRAHAGLRDKAEIRLAQAFIPGDSDPRLAAKGPLALQRFAGFLKKRNALAICGIDVFGELLRFKRRPRPVGIQPQLEIGDGFQ